jgi:hypothetical protein
MIQSSAAGAGLQDLDGFLGLEIAPDGREQRRVRV